MCAGELTLASHVAGMALAAMEGEQGCSSDSCCVCKCCSVGCQGQRALVLVCNACSGVERACSASVPSALQPCVGNVGGMTAHAFPWLVRWDGCGRRLPKVL